MDSLIVLMGLLGLGYWVYRFGKRIGSKKGFHAGRRRGRYRRK
jgi:hypothetical protein